jgi:hypothetical protein
VVHGNEVTLLITSFVVVFIAAYLVSSTNQVDDVKSSPFVAQIINGATHLDHTHKNSRSTRRERRNQQSVNCTV